MVNGSGTRRDAISHAQWEHTAGPKFLGRVGGPWSARVEAQTVRLRAPAHRPRARQRRDCLEARCCRASVMFFWRSHMNQIFIGSAKNRIVPTLRQVAVAAGLFTLVACASAPDRKSVV